MRCMNKDCDGHYQPVCDKCEYTVMNDEIKIDDIKITVRMENIFKQNGIKTLNQLTQLSSRRLLLWRGVSKKTLNDIREVLASHNLSLLDETVDIEVKRMILQDLPKLLRDIMGKVEDIKNEFRFISYKIEQVAEFAERTKRKCEKNK